MYNFIYFIVIEGERTKWVSKPHCIEHIVLKIYIYVADLTMEMLCFNFFSCMSLINF